MSSVGQRIRAAGRLFVLLESIFVGASSLAEPPHPYGLLVPGQFLHIPGPNPVLLPGPAGAWDDGVIEAADAFHDGSTYYFYYHGTGAGKGYRLGVATANRPLGPFRKHGNAPVLDVGPPGSWDDRNVACAMVLKQSPGKCRMWYSATGSSPQHAKWSIGLATAAHPLGPWTKYEKNPILPDFGYVGGVVQVKGKYFLYTEHPIGTTGPDYGPVSLAVADSPTGPWTRWTGNPVLKEGPKGAWDHGGFSEAEVFSAGGALHMFYSGATIHPERIRSQESIGYAFSTDGRRFVKHPANPVGPREAVPNAAAFSEVHALHEPPLIYLYHTLRYLTPPTAADRKKFPLVEHLGIQVLATARPFELEMPILQRETLGPKTATCEVDSPPIRMNGIARVTLLARFVSGPKATHGLRIHVLRSSDGSQWNEADVFPAACQPGRQTQMTKPLDPGSLSRLVKILVENPDPAESVTGVEVTVRLGG